MPAFLGRKCCAAEGIFKQRSSPKSIEIMLKVKRSDDNLLMSRDQRKEGDT
jgi:hypothetical protein